ncbi:MAG: GatB/YqeY domain-containing protein [Alphaproteobacteria bacterium]|nr:GatB/YqeY domain-containing protein [Alphaproteobacteria bacterium]
MSLRERFTEAMKTAMKAGDAATTSTVRMIIARLKEVDIAARPKGIDKVADDEVMAMLRGMVKSRRESVELYKQGGRAELAAKEEAEIAVIESFLPQSLSGPALDQAIAAAVAEAGAATIKDMGKVMGVLKAKYPGQLDLAAVGPMVKARLGG